jgi:hypothetical protein
MTGVRVQASVHSGKAVLYFRNTMEKQVVVKGVLLERANGEEKRATVAAFPITLGPGEIHPVDVSEPILELLKPVQVVKPQKKRLRLRILLDPDQSMIAECKVILDCGGFIEFAC